MKPLVIDLSHYDPAEDYNEVKASGIVGVIYKATQGAGYQDPTYHEERKKALAAGLKWGAYHFGDDSDSEDQATNFLTFANIKPGDLFALDFEDNGASTMSLATAREFIIYVERSLDRPRQCVVYSGNLLKEELEGPDAFFNRRRLWLAQYSSSCELPPGYSEYFLWQYTGDGDGPHPHTVPGCCEDIDLNVYDGSAEELAAEWASGSAEPEPTPPEALIVNVTIQAPRGVTVNVVQETA